MVLLVRGAPNCQFQSPAALCRPLLSMTKYLRTDPPAVIGAAFDPQIVVQHRPHQRRRYFEPKHTISAPLLLRAEIKAPRRKGNDARNGFRALFVIGHHATADAERMRRRVQRVGPAFAPAPEGVRRMVTPACSCASRHNVSAAMSISSGQTTSVPYSPTRTCRNNFGDRRNG